MFADAIIINRLLPFVFYTHAGILCLRERRYTDIYLSFTVLVIALLVRDEYLCICIQQNCMLEKSNNNTNYQLK